MVSGVQGKGYKKFGTGYGQFGAGGTVNLGPGSSPVHAASASRTPTMTCDDEDPLPGSPWMLAFVLLKFGFGLTSGQITILKEPFGCNVILESFVILLFLEPARACALSGFRGPIWIVLCTCGVDGKARMLS